MQRRSRTKEAGFTLVEMIVAVALFAIVMLVCISTLLALVNANRKAQALQSVMNNLNIALDGMVRSIRMGTDYHCSAVGAVAPLSPADCPDNTTGDTTFAFEPYGSSSTASPWIYSFNAATHRIQKSENGQPPIPITAPEITIEDMRFYVIGTTPGDNLQPKVLIVIKGTTGTPGSTAQTTFHVQATAVQRVLDL